MGTRPLQGGVRIVLRTGAAESMWLILGSVTADRGAGASSRGRPAVTGVGGRLTSATAVERDSIAAPVWYCFEGEEEEADLPVK